MKTVLKENEKISEIELKTVNEIFDACNIKIFIVNDEKQYDNLEYNFEDNKDNTIIDIKLMSNMSFIFPPKLEFIYFYKMSLQYIYDKFVTGKIYFLN